MTPVSKDLWALILGGSSGIGLATARKLAKEGFHICIVHRDMRSRMVEAEAAFEEIKSYGVSLLTFNIDASQEAPSMEVLNEFEKRTPGGKVKVLVHAISKGNLKTLLPPPDFPVETKDTDPLTQKFKEIDELLKGHYQSVGLLDESDIAITHQAMSTSLIHWCRNLLREGLFSEGARVIALTSEGNKRTWISYAAIAMAKSSLEVLIKYLAIELAPYGITANVIQAGITDTPSLRMIPGNEVIKASTINRNPFGRLTQPSDIANFIYLLTKDEAAWLNGAIIPVDGGEHLG